MRVLVTRPLPDGERTAVAVRQRGHDVTVAPLMQVKPIAADLSGQWAAVIISSANALRALSAQQIGSLLKTQLFAVGRHSAEVAYEAGFGVIHSADGDAGDLIRLVIEHRANKEGALLYLAGQDRAADIEGELAKHGIEVRTAIVYQNVTTGFPPGLVHALGDDKIDVVLHFSRRSAGNYVNGARDADLLAAALRPRQLCISAKVAEPLEAVGAKEIAVAARPDEASLLALLSPPRP